MSAFCNIRRNELYCTQAEAPPPPERKMALYEYIAQQADELGFSAGDIITIISKEHADWWKGQIGDRTGVFPSNFVGNLPTN
jgi:hypothetical protein